jgi:hypothetical protein
MRSPLAPFAVALLLVAVAGCSHDRREPTVTQAGDQLRQAVQRVYDNRLGAGAPRVSSDATADQPCGDGRARRVYAATVPSRGFKARDLAFEYSIGVVDRFSGWKLDLARDARDTVGAVAGDGHARLSVTTSADGSTYTVSGRTDCLPSG